jgi:hypothetical protein
MAKETVAEQQTESLEKEACTCPPDFCIQMDSNPAWIPIRKTGFGRSFLLVRVFITDLNGFSQITLPKSI